MTDDQKIEAIVNRIVFEAESMTEHKIFELKKVISDFFTHNNKCSDDYLLGQINELIDSQYTNFYEYYYSKILDKLEK